MWIKVCGIRDCTTAQQLAELPIDAIGLNFYRQSPRSVDLSTARAISELLPPEMLRVGLFVNHPIEEIEAIVSECGLNMVQLHGDESPSFMSQLRRRLPTTPLMRAFRMGPEGLAPLGDYLRQCAADGCAVAACLIDAHVAGVYGGSGKTAPWEQLSAEYRTGEWPQLVLAGGLKLENVAQAISVVRPWGVDVASGVESAPGVKDLELVKRFVFNARQAAALA